MQGESQIQRESHRAAVCLLVPSHKLIFQNAQNWCFFRPGEEPLQSWKESKKNFSFFLLPLGSTGKSSLCWELLPFVSPPGKEVPQPPFRSDFTLIIALRMRKIPSIRLTWKPSLCSFLGCGYRRSLSSVFVLHWFVFSLLFSGENNPWRGWIREVQLSGIRAKHRRAKNTD